MLLSGIVVAMTAVLRRALAVIDVAPTESDMAVLKVAGCVWAVMLVIPSLLLIFGIA
ncbi:MAG: hypothetical protein NVSMB55_03910 [Mycobacteriales bacterium]